MPFMKKPQCHRLRTGRISEPNQLYLLSTVCNNREPLFSDITLGRIVVRSLRHHHEHGYVSSLTFVVMPDHLHWLVRLSPGIVLPHLMKSVKSYTARETNQRCNTQRKRIWQPGFHDHALRHEEEVLHTARYIVANPLRARLVRRLGDYPLWDAVWL